MPPLPPTLPATHNDPTYSITEQNFKHKTTVYNTSLQFTDYHEIGLIKDTK